MKSFSVNNSSPLLANSNNASYIYVSISLFGYWETRIGWFFGMVSINWFDSGEYSKKYVTGIKVLTYIRCVDFGSVYILRGFIGFAHVGLGLTQLDFLISLLLISMNNFVRFFGLISVWSLLTLKPKIRNRGPVLKLFWLMSLKLRVASLCLDVALDSSSLHMTSIRVTPSMVVICRSTIGICGRRIVIWLLRVIIFVILVLIGITLRILVLHSWVSFSAIGIFLRRWLNISVSRGIPGSSLTHSLS